MLPLIPPSPREPGRASPAAERSARTSVGPTEGSAGRRTRPPGSQVAPAHVLPAGDHDPRLVVLGPAPGVQGDRLAAPAADRVLGARPPEGGQGGGVAAA